MLLQLKIIPYGLFGVQKELRKLIIASTISILAAAYIFNEGFASASSFFFCGALYSGRKGEGSQQTTAYVPVPPVEVQSNPTPRLSNHVVTNDQGELLLGHLVDAISHHTDYTPTAVFIPVHPTASSSVAVVPGGLGLEHAPYGGHAVAARVPLAQDFPVRLSESIPTRQTPSPETPLTPGAANNLTARVRSNVKRDAEDAEVINKIAGDLKYARKKNSPVFEITPEEYSTLQRVARRSSTEADTLRSKFAVTARDYAAGLADDSTLKTTAELTHSWGQLADKTNNLLRKVNQKLSDIALENEMRAKIDAHLDEDALTRPQPTTVAPLPESLGVATTPHAPSPASPPTGVDVVTGAPCRGEIEPAYVHGRRRPSKLDNLPVAETRPPSPAPIASEPAGIEPEESPTPYLPLQLPQVTESVFLDNCWLFLILFIIVCVILYIL
jgi:hypothetical protein